MSNKQEQALRRAFSAMALVAVCTCANASAVLAKDPLEAAQELAGVTQTDPNGFALMIASISMLFVFAITLIVLTSMHVFKKKPRRTVSAPRQPEPSYTSSAVQR